MHILRTKGWFSLDKEERAWVKGRVESDNAGYYLRDSIGRNFAHSTAVARYILDNYSIKVSEVQSAVAEAARQRSDEWFDFMTAYCFDKKLTTHKDWTRSFGLFSALESGVTDERWKKVWDFHQKLPEAVRLSVQEILEVAINRGQASVIRDILTTKVPADTETYRQVLATVEAKGSVESLRIVAECADHFPQGRGVLQDCLYGFVASDKVAYVDKLLTGGYGVNASLMTESMMNNISSNKHVGVEMMRLLAENGARMRDIVPPVIDNFAKTYGDAHELTLYLDGFCDGAYIRKVKAAEAAKKYGERYKLIDEDSFAEVKNLPSGKTLTMIFNFSTRQQTVVVESDHGLSQTTIPFAEIEGADAVNHAAAIFTDLGGNAALVENTVVPIRKSRLGQKAG